MVVKNELMFYFSFFFLFAQNDLFFLSKELVYHDSSANIYLCNRITNRSMFPWQVSKLLIISGVEILFFLDLLKFIVSIIFKLGCVFLTLHNKSGQYTVSKPLFTTFILWKSFFCIDLKVFERHRLYFLVYLDAHVCWNYAI